LTAKFRQVIAIIYTDYNSTLQCWSCDWPRTNSHTHCGPTDCSN